MKVNLIVITAGPNMGRAIAVVGAKFTIGRDPGCQLRPASQAVSKIHCSITLNDGNIFIEDFSSTNGTVVNGTPVSGILRIFNGDLLKVGPLEFKLEVIPTLAVNDPTPVPEVLKKPSTAMAAAKKPVTASSPSIPKKEAIPSQKVAKDPSSEFPSLANTPSSQAEEADSAAALLLSIDDLPSGELPVVPDGSTVMELPSIDASGRVILPKKPEKVESAESSSAANDLLKKYFRRTS